MSEENKETKQEDKRIKYEVDSRSLARSIYLDVYEKNKNSNFLSIFPKEKILKALQNPQENEKIIRNMSNFLYFTSSNYRRIVNYFAHMPKLDHYVIPHKQEMDKKDHDKIRKAYMKTLFKLDTMNIKHEFQKIQEVAWREGIFYGYVREGEDSFFIQKLDPDFCHITGIEDGSLVYEFDFTYFNIYPAYLDNYPSEFRKIYDNLSDKDKKQKTVTSLVGYEGRLWRTLDSQKLVCHKIDETIFYPYPPMASLFPLIYDVEENRDIQRASNEMDNYKVLVGKIPYNKEKTDSVNNFGLDLGLAVEFSNKINEEIPDGMGFLLSPYEKIEAINLHNTGVDKNIVKNSEDGLYRNAGVSVDLFGGSNSTDAAASRAVAIDEAEVFAMLRQYERLINKWLKMEEAKKYRFKFKFLDITNLNDNAVINALQKSASYGIPIKFQLAAAFGMSPSETIAMNVLENDIFELPEKFVPLQSANTQSDKGRDDGGRRSEEEVNQDGEGEGEK